MSNNADRDQLTRRKFMQATTAASAVFAWEHHALAAITSMRSHDLGKANALSEFAYAAVTFSPGPHEAQLEQTHRILMGLNEESLLRPFRIAAGMPAPGYDLNGWYSAPRFLGETFGQWISALSRYYAAKGDEPTRLKVERLLALYIETVEPTGNIFRSNGNPVYFHDKLARGITDAAELCNHAASRALLSKLLDASGFVLEKKSSETLHSSVKRGGENFNFAETYFLAWKASGDVRYFDLAKSDLNDGFIEPLSRGTNELPGRHAYSHTNAMCSAAKAYLVLGEKKYLQAAVNGLAFAEQQSFATGAFGPEECFLPRPVREGKSPETGEPIYGPARETVAESILHDYGHFETGCSSYAHFKLTRYLIRITRNSLYGDSMERVMYNATLGALPMNTLGKAFYQSSYHRRARKKYFDGYDNMLEDEWPCCSGTLPQVVADYRISTYFQDANGVFVNLYIPSTLRWNHKGGEVSLTQSGNYPLSSDVRFSLELAHTSSFELRFRIPAWSKAPSLRVNGELVTESIRPGTFATVRRKWRSGDKLELVLPRQLELKAADSTHPDLVALCCGPLVLFAIGEELPKLTREKLLSVSQVSAGSAEWRSADIRFLPWWIIKDETYTTYHDVSEARAERARARHSEIVDV